MEVISHNTQIAKRKDTSLLVVMHLCQLLTYITGFGGLIVPLIIWASKKDEIEDLDEHGKQVINFQITLLVLTFISIPLILLFGLGILMLIFLGVIGFVLPIVNAIKANNDESPSTFCTFNFL